MAEQMGASEELIAAMRKAIDTSGAKSVKKIEKFVAALLNWCGRMYFLVPNERKKTAKI